MESTLHFYVTNIAGCCWSYHSPLIVGTEIYIAKEGRVVKIGVIARAKSRTGCGDFSIDGVDVGEVLDLV